jgi:hypothetical protein
MNDFQQLVHARIQSCPDDTEIIAGSFGKITKQVALEHVKNNDAIGQAVIETEIQFLKNLKSGDFYAHAESTTHITTSSPATPKQPTDDQP